MKTSEPKKKIWVKPSVTALSIKKDTFSGSSGTGPEEAQKNMPTNSKQWN